VTYKDTLPRFIGQDELDVSDRYSSNFWAEKLVDKVRGSTLLVRPFKNSKGEWFIKILHPIHSLSNPSWNGITCTLDLVACSEFIQILNGIIIEVDMDEKERANMRT